MRLIDADSLYKIIEKDKCELNNHKDGRSRSVHNGEYSHFLKRIAEQSEIHLSVQLCLPNGQMVKNVELNDSKCRFHGMEKRGVA